MRVLFDQNIPRSLRQFLPGHDIRTAAEMGWSALSNGLILDAAEAAGFHVMITADRNMRHQQNMTGQKCRREKQGCCTYYRLHGTDPSTLDFPW